MDSQIAYFADIEQFKIDIILLILSKSRFILLICFYYFGQVNYFTESGQDRSLPKTISTLSI